MMMKTMTSTMMMMKWMTRSDAVHVNKTRNSTAHTPGATAVRKCFGCEKRGSSFNCQIFVNYNNLTFDRTPADTQATTRPIDRSFDRPPVSQANKAILPQTGHRSVTLTQCNTDCHRAQLSWTVVQPGLCLFLAAVVDVLDDVDWSPWKVNKI